MSRVLDLIGITVTYGEIYKTFNFFKIKHFPTGKLNPLNMNTIYLKYIFCKLRVLRNFITFFFSRGGHSGHGAGVRSLPVFLRGYLLQRE